MPEAIPSVLAPYLQDCFAHSSLTLLTSTLSTPVNWLLVRLLHVALTSPQIVVEGQISPSSDDGQRKVILVSLLRSTSQWLELTKKIGIDLASVSKTGQLVYIDGLNFGVQSPTARSVQSTSLKSLRLDDISATVQAQHRAWRMRSQAYTGPLTIVIDGLDFILASQPEVDVIRIQRFLSQIRTDAHAVIVTCSADSPLLRNRHDGATPLEREHSTLATSLAHQGSWVFQLRGLDTGAAKDVTGVLRISKGGSYDDEGSQDSLEEGEWLYQLKGDGSARVWLRGQ